jgi:hypothetical protein
MRMRLLGIGAALLVLMLLMPAAGAPTPVGATIEVAIHQIQYTTAPSGDSPYRGQIVTTGGLATAIYPGGYVLQELLSAPWTGIYVADSQRRPSPGSFVVLTGKVVEIDGMTTLTEISEYTTIQSGNALPAPVLVRTSDIAFGSPNAEPFEGVLVSTGKVATASVGAGGNLWEIADSSGVKARVGNRAGYGYRPQVGQDLAAVHGVLFAANGAFQIEPRADSDILPITAQPGISGVVSLERSSKRAGIIVQLSGLPTAVTKSDGSYALSSVPPGTYTVRAYAPGYLVAERQNVQIMPGNTLTLPPVTLVGGDANNDGKINLQDLVIVARSFGACPPADSAADITGDGCVNLNDLVLVGQNYGRTGPTPW